MRRREFLALASASAVGVSGLRSVPARAAAAVPAPIAILASRWDTDPWSRGSYSALGRGCSPRVRSTIASAVIGGRVVLAGEYASVDHPATANGAYRSGISAAKRLLDRVDPSRVIVVGAGIAGAAAASALADEDVEVIVVEARDRIGGRIHSDDRWGAPVELGAAWIHGLSGNPLVPLASASGLRLVPTDYADEAIRDTVTGRESAAAERADNQLVGLTDVLSEQEGAPAQTVAAWLAAHGWRPDRLGQWAQAVEITQEYGLDPSALGVNALQEGQDQEGGDAFVAGGFARIPRDLLTDADVRLSTPASAVIPGGRSVTVQTARGALTADAVVVAVPLPLVQAGSPAIAGMPSSVRTALRSLSTGSLEKVILRYDRQWWGQEQVLGIVGGGVTGAPEGSLAALRWTEYYSLTDLLGFPALVGFSGGQAARTRPLTDAGCAAEATAALSAAYRG